MLMSMCSLAVQELLLWIYKKNIYINLKSIVQYCKEILNYAFSVNLYLTEIYAQKKGCISIMHPSV